MEAKVFMYKKIIYELKTIETKLDQLIALKRADRIKDATKPKGDK